MSNLTTDITRQNIDYVRAEIEKKLGSDPYLASREAIAPIYNDMDHHPYSRMFRGVYYYPEPIIFEREAGWRPQENMCYDLNIPPTPIQEEKVPRHCYQAACSTVFPCIPEYLQKESDKALLDTMLNKACIVQYR